MAEVIVVGKIVRAGNSSAVRLTEPVMKAAGLVAGQSIEISAAEGRIIISPSHKTESYDLAQLIAGITDENCHGGMSFGAPMGRENK